MDDKKIISAVWVGRFGNRCHSYLYGKHIEEKFGYKFYVSKEWEGSVLFKNPAPVADYNFLKYDYLYEGGHPSHSDFKLNVEKISNYNKDYNDSIEFINPDDEEDYGKPNTAFVSLVKDSEHFYKKVKLSDIKRYFEFSDELKETELFKELSSLKGTYDVAHFRRTDIAASDYVGGHCMVSKKSYEDAFIKYGVDGSKIVWVSDEEKIGWNRIGWKWDKPIPSIGGKEIDWLPDFLKLVFARKIFRANSAFSLFAAWLSDAEIFSPELHTYSPKRELYVDFVNGNHPHWHKAKPFGFYIL